MRRLTTDMGHSDARPYFLWDEDVSVAELRAILNERDEDDPTRLRLLGKMLREARDLDVWSFVRPLDVARALPKIERRLGRRAAFWHFLIDGWREDGLLPAA